MQKIGLMWRTNSRLHKRSLAISMTIAIGLFSLGFASIMIDWQLSQKGHSIDTYAVGGEYTLIDASGPSQPVGLGETVTFPIIVDPNTALAGVQFSLTFDPLLVTVDSVQEGGLLSQGGASTYFYPGLIDNQNGTITGVAGAIVSPGQTVSTAGTFATITLTTGSTEGICDFILSNVIVGDSLGQSVSVSMDNGRVMIDINQAPILGVIGNKSVNEGETLQFTISAIDPDDDSMAYSASNLPSGASFDTNTQAFSWTPNYTQSGTYTSVHFEVSDGSLTDSEDITISVNNTNRAPVLSSIGNKSINEGATLQFTTSATDPDNDSMTYSASNLPSGASFDSATHVFSWTPNYAQAGTYSAVHFQVSDGDLTDSENIIITTNQPHESWDINQDGSVNVLDMVRIGQHWDETGSVGWIVEDANEDGTIDVLDMILIGQNWTA